MREARINNGKRNHKGKGNKNNHKQNNKRKKKRRFPNVRQISMTYKMKIYKAILSLRNTKSYKIYMSKNFNKSKGILIQSQISLWKMIKMNRKMKMNKFK